jgi:hypothetical protein
LGVPVVSWTRERSVFQSLLLAAASGSRSRSGLATPLTEPENGKKWVCESEKNVEKSHRTRKHYFQLEPQKACLLICYEKCVLLIKMAS